MVYAMSRKQKYFTEEDKKKHWRASVLLADYNRKDEKYNRGKGDLTVEWIIENIFTQICPHCKRSGWKIMGCNRIDNSKPHTMDNVEPCCGECNVGLDGRTSKQIDQIDKVSGEVIRSWKSVAEAARELGFDEGNISRCVNGKMKTHKGYMWKRKRG